MSTKAASANQSENVYSERTILGSIGFILGSSVCIISIYSQVCFTSLSNSPVMIGGLRGLAFVSMALMYLFFIKFLKGKEAIFRSNLIRILAFVLSLLLPLLVLSEQLFFVEIPLWLITLSWVLWGCTTSFFTCSWVDWQSSLDESGFGNFNLTSFALAGCVVLGVLTMASPTNIIVLLAMNVFSFVLLLHSSNAVPKVDDSYREQLVTKETSFSRNGSYIMLVDGVLLGLIACCLCVWIMDFGLNHFLMGFAFLATALLCYIFWKKNSALLLLEHSQLVFFPVVICGLLFVEFTTPPWNILFAFLLFPVLDLFNFTNYTNLAVRADLSSNSIWRFFSKGRIFIVFGQGLGWMCGSFFSTAFGKDIMQLCIIFLVALVCLYLTIATLYPDKYPLIINQNEAEPNTSNTAESQPTKAGRPYKEKCAQVAALYDLTPREAEILFFLAKGRNAKYIADNLFVAERTIKTHMYHIYQKLGTHSQQDLIDIVENITIETDELNKK